MQFKDEYDKMNKKNRLSEDFINDLAAKMTDVYEQNRKSNKTEKKETTIKLNECNKNKVHEIQTTIVKQDEKGTMRIKMSALAAVAAVVVFVSSIAVISSLKNNIIADPGKDPEDSLMGTATYISTDAGAAKATVSAVTSVTTGSLPDDSETPVSNAVTQTNSNNDIQNSYAPFASQAELQSFTDKRTAEGSPLKVGYEAAGYRDLFGEFYDLQFGDNEYQYVFKDPHALKASSPYSVYEESGLVTGIRNQELSAGDIEQFNRLLSYADQNIGKDNYFIYDIYTYNYKLKTEDGLNYTSTATKESQKDYCVELVLKNYYERYISTGYNKDSFIVTLEISNDDSTDAMQDTDSVLKSEYEGYKLNQDAADAFYNDFSSQFPDCAVSIGSITHEYSGINIYSPFKSWVKPTISGNDEYSGHISRYSNSCIMPEKGDTVTDAVPVMDVCLYFRPGTSADSITNYLKDMKPMFNKYHIMSLTVDILNSYSDFQRYKESGGCILDTKIDSSYRRYCAAYSDEFPDWRID